jgi:hypothetical protein
MVFTLSLLSVGAVVAVVAKLINPQLLLILQVELVVVVELTLKRIVYLSHPVLDIQLLLGLEVDLLVIQHQQLVVTHTLSIHLQCLLRVLGRLLILIVVDWHHLVLVILSMMVVMVVVHGGFLEVLVVVRVPVLVLMAIMVTLLLMFLEVLAERHPPVVEMVEEEQIIQVLELQLCKLVVVAEVVQTSRLLVVVLGAKS